MGTEGRLAAPDEDVTMDDVEHMRRAMAAAATVRSTTAPNPWVGSVIVRPGGEAGGTEEFVGATAPPGGAHAEVVALSAAGERARGATLYTTLEPCVHHGRTPPCTEAIVAAGVARVVIGVEDPDPQVAGRGAAALQAAGVAVTVGVAADEVAEQLAPYLKHRSTGRPWVVLKLAASLDARTAAPDGTSRWITGEAARRDAHRLRACSDAVLVGAGTVRTDDPELTVRLDDGVERDQPLRVVLGRAPAGARVLPALELSGDLEGVLADLGQRGVLQVLVEGGPTVAHDFHAAGLVDRYVLYLAPVFFGGDDGRPLFAGPGAGTIGDVWKGKLVSIERVGEDLRVEVAA
ncbi:MAG TPA: bifunctional diaminohydroxyphosphoribosylaminopyrimidine deaminase/5-amino-6-(5-phosphoribosylamino)uracil reductase RibD [Acidimicrobiales bacterium]|nr:bifunctional diaminohydroxyphosphoribosylaminopyrimidine deaminase/5-amino-6-(5-phosphoribosylamino)uracil reductase RibD [Acidimicrobiales bacterium]